MWFGERRAHRGLDEARDDRELRKRERDDRQDGGAPSVLRPASDGQEAQRQAEDELQDRHDDEGRDGEAGEREHRHQAGSRPARSAALRGEHAERHTEGERHAQRRGAEAGGDRQRAGDELVHGKVAPMKARPEIAACEAQQITPELLRQRQIEAVEPHEIGLDRRVEPAFEIEGAAGRKPHENEARDEDEKERRDRRGKPAGEKADHASIATALPGWCSMTFACQPRSAGATRLRER